MPLVVEDGSGLPTAEAFVSAAEADAYFAARGAPATWSGSSDTQKEAALRQATDFLEALAGDRWLGTRATSAQRLAFPRDGVVVDGVALGRAPLPRALREACCEAALRARSETNGLMPDVEGASVAEEEAGVGPLRERVRYAGSKGPAKTFARVEALLAPLMRSSRGGVRA